MSDVNSPSGSAMPSPQGAPAAGLAGAAGAANALGRYWKGLTARERYLAQAAALVVGLGLLWVVAVQPAWRTLAAAGAQHDALDAQLQAMQRLAGEAQQLRAIAPVAPEQALAALQAATQRLGDKGRLVITGDRAVLNLNGVGPGALRDWLAEVRAGARARPLEANLLRGSTGYTGTLVVAIGGAR